MKHIIGALALLVTGLIYAQQITGVIVDNNGNGIEGLTVELLNSENTTLTDAEGNFSIEKIEESNVIVISGVGFKTKEIEVVEKDDLGQITVYEGIELLDVEVQGTRSNKFSRKETAYVGKMPLKDMENATVYSTVTTELLESQIATNIDDALNNATGVFKLWESTNRDTKGTGFFSSRGFATQPQLVDGMPGFVFSNIDPSYIERIEVIKGPNATLFGSTVTSLGGLINMVTKKPYKGFGGNISYTAGSFDLHRITADVNTPISKKEDIYFRLNTSYLTQNSFQDAGFKKSFFVAPSLTYRVNNRLNLSAGLEYANNEQANPAFVFVRRGLAMPTHTVEEMGLDPNKSFTSNDLSIKSPTLNVRAIADYKISDTWNSQTIASYNNISVEGYYQYMYEGAAVAFGVLQPLTEIPYPPLQDAVNGVLGEAFTIAQNDAFARVFTYRDGGSNKFNIQQNFTGNFKIGEMRNRMVLGLDYVNRKEESNNKNGNPVLAQNSNFPTIIEILNQFQPGQGDILAGQLYSFGYFDGFFDPQGNPIQNSFTPNATYEINKTELDAIFNQIPANKIETASKTYAAYVSDVLNVTDNLIVNIGLRLDHFDQDGDVNNDLDDYTKTTLSPTAGVVYQLIPKELTLFANYQTGFINNDPDIERVLVTNDNGTQEYVEKANTLAPTEAKQFEIGFKTSFLKNKLNAGISYYDITVNNFKGSDPSAQIFPRAILFEEMKSNGIEVELNANPIRGLNLRASYAYNDAKITDGHSPTDGIDYPQIENYRLEVAGPRNLYNFWADYKFETVASDFLKNLGLGFGFNGASEHLTMNDAIAGTFRLPSYTIFNAAAYYDASKYRIGFKVNNLTNEQYYTGWSTINPQAPRAFLGTVTYKF